MKRNTPSISLAGSELNDVRHVCAFFANDDEEYRVSRIHSFSLRRSFFANIVPRQSARHNSNPEV